MFGRRQAVEHASERAGAAGEGTRAAAAARAHSGGWAGAVLVAPSFTAGAETFFAPCFPIFSPRQARDKRRNKLKKTHVSAGDDAARVFGDVSRRAEVPDLRRLRPCLRELRDGDPDAGAGKKPDKTFSWLPIKLSTEQQPVVVAGAGRRGVPRLQLLRPRRGQRAADVR
eukprot:COSAG06_NODE_167_length_21546_cov_35.001352_36_plen_170_part_00